MKFFFLFSILLSISEQANSQSLKNCEKCSVDLIKQKQLVDLSVDEIRLLTNEIYARNGYQFDNRRFQEYFQTKEWYSSKNDNTKVQLNDIEKQNIKLFQDQTKQLKIAQNELTHQLKTFKELVLSNNNTELKSTFGFYYENSNDEFEPRNLKEVLSKIDLNDINYYKSNGLNSTITDNGFVKIIYKISISGKSIDLFYNFMSHTDLVDQIDEFTDYQSESEYMCNWQFEFINDKLRFKRFVIAG